MTLVAPFVSAVAAGLIVRALLTRMPVVPGGSSPTPKRRRWSGHADLEVTPAQFWGVSVAAGIVTYLVVAGMTSLTVIALMPAVVVGTLPRAYFGRRRARRVLEIRQSWPDGIRDIISSVRSGASLPNAVESLARFGPAPLREAFASFGTYSRSLGFVPALEMVRSDLADPTSDRVVEVLIVAYEKGGAVVPEILGDLAEATTRDIWTLEEIRTEALEQKINSRVVFVLPWVVLVAMTARSGAFREFYSSPAGALVAAIGGAMSIVGIVLVSRLGRQPEEPRVLTSGGGSP